MIYIQKDGRQYPIENFRSLHPNAGFSGDMPTSALLDHFGYTVVDISLTAEEIEAQVQEAASEILEGQDDKIVALALGLVDLVIAARDGQIAGLSKPQVRRAFKRRIADNLRNRNGV